MNWLTREITDDDIYDWTVGRMVKRTVKMGILTCLIGVAWITVGWVDVLASSAWGILWLLGGSFLYSIGRTWK